MKKLVITIALYLLSVNVLLADEGAESGGMPQLDITTFPEQIFWFIVIFILLYLFISKYAVPKIKIIKSSRERLINQNYATNNKNNAETEKIKKIISLQLKDAEENSRSTIKKLLKDLTTIEEKRIDEVKAKNKKTKATATKEINNIDYAFFSDFRASLSEIVTITLGKLNVSLPEEVILKQVKSSIALREEVNKDV